MGTAVALSVQPAGGERACITGGCRVNVCRLMQRTDINKVFLVTFPTAA